MMIDESMSQLNMNGPWKTGALDIDYVWPREGAI